MEERQIEDDAKRVRVNESEDTTMQRDLHDDHDLHSLSEEIDKLNTREFHPDEVREGKIKHLVILEEFGVFDVIGEEEASVMKKASMNWEIAARGGNVKCRFVVREFKWLEERYDVFAPASLALTSRFVEYLMCKDNRDYDKQHHKLVGFIAYCTLAFLQTPQDVVCAVDPPAEWIMLRRELGLPWKVKWQLKKHLPGQLGAGFGWTEYCVSCIESIGGERCDSLPHFFRPDSLRLKDLKRTRTRGWGSRSIHQSSREALANVVKALKLDGTHAAKTPYLSEEKPEADEELSLEVQAVFRSCIGGLMYLCIDRPGIQREVCILALIVRAPTEYDMRRLTKVARYLMGTADFGTSFKSIGRDEFAHDVELACYSDSDWGDEKQSRKSMSSVVITADERVLCMIVRKQQLVALSSDKAELYDIALAGTESFAPKGLFEWLGFRVAWKIYTNNSAANAMGLRIGVGKVRHLDVRSLWVQHAIRHLHLKLCEVCGTCNAADLGTKSHTAKGHQEELVKMIGLSSGSMYMEGLPLIEVS
eukprot:6492341-Amphidinium_carterae.2